MVHSSVRHLVCFILLAGSAACARDTEDRFPTPSGADGGLPERAVSGGGGPEAGSQGDRPPGPVTGDGGGVSTGDGSAAIKLTVTIDLPKMDAVIEAKKRFTP